MSTSWSAPFEPVRVMIWSPPRSTATTFARSMSANGETEVLVYEPYLSSIQYGAHRERKTSQQDLIPPPVNDHSNYGYVSSLLKPDYPGAKVLFKKGKMDNIKNDSDALEPEFKNSLFICHPRIAFPSIRAMFEKFVGLQEVDRMIVAKFHEMYHDMERFYNKVSTTTRQGAPPIIDEDDLIKEPEKILPQFCLAMDINFTPEMVAWKKADQRKLSSHCRQAPDLTKKMASSAAVEEMIRHAMPVYERLYALRIQPEPPVQDSKDSVFW